MLIHLAWIAPLVLLIFFLGSPRFRGDIAERRVRRILAAGLEPSRYTVFNDVVVPFGGGTARIDHVVVSRHGIFVIDSEYAPGHVAGSDVQDRWKRRRLGRTWRLDNPIHRNRVQAEALASVLDFPMSVFQRVVVLVGMDSFRKPRPEEVLEPERLLARIRAASRQKLDDDQVARALRGIESARLASAGGLLGSRIALVRGLLFVALLSGLYMAFGEDVRQWSDELGAARERAAHPEAYRADGSPRSEQELWEDTLVCAWSADTGRCACYDPQGERVTLAPERCRELAERGSILKQ